MIQNACYTLFSKNLVTSSISVLISSEDKEFFHFTVSYTIITNLYKLLINDLVKSYERIVKDNIFIKTIGYSIITQDIKNEHYDIFTDLKEVEKEKKLVTSVLNLKQKYGKNSILKALDYEENATIRERNKMIGGHNGGEDDK